jgi:hypothetical protein
MRQNLRSSKLQELTLKTDRQLLALIARRLETGTKLAQNSSRTLQAEAEQACEDAGLWLPLVRHAAEEKRRLQCRLDQLRGQLTLASNANVRIHAACS